jgi:branched-subunit amino acid aminotransferase/4-amino-4-deoxychorismate lyase
VAECRSADAPAEVPLIAAWINGRPAAPGHVDVLGATPYGHFTTMQVRGGAAQGLDLHLQRLQSATLEMFGIVLGVDRILAAMGAARPGSAQADCTMRIAVHARGFDPERPGAASDVDLMVAVAPAAEPGQAALRLKSVLHSRPLPHLKHVALLPLYHQRRLALEAGFDDAVLVDDDDRVCEGTFWNIGFRDDEGAVVWPQAAALRGTCERLLQSGLDEMGVRQHVRPVCLAELPGFRAAFIANSRGVQVVAAVDDVAWGADGQTRELLGQALASRPWQVI